MTIRYDELMLRWSERPRVSGNFKRWMNGRCWPNFFFFIFEILLRLHRKRHLNWQHQPLFFSPGPHVFFPLRTLAFSIFSLLSYADHDLTWASGQFSSLSGVLILCDSFALVSVFSCCRFFCLVRGLEGWRWRGWIWCCVDCGNGCRGTSPPNLGLDLKVYEDDNITSPLSDILYPFAKLCATWTFPVKLMEWGECGS